MSCDIACFVSVDETSAAAAEEETGTSETTDQLKGTLVLCVSYNFRNINQSIKWFILCCSTSAGLKYKKSWYLSLVVMAGESLRCFCDCY